MVAFTRLAERGDTAPTRWRVEQVEHPELPVWLAVADDEQGELLLGVSLGAIGLLEAHARRQGATIHRGEPRSRAATQVREYLAGSRREFDLRLFGFGTAFEQQAWLALTQIPFGETRSYAEQARMLPASSPAPGYTNNYARAVGRANGRNLLPIVVPCHRVIGSDGSLTGFAGGLALKRWLLAHEGVRLSDAAGPRLVPREQLALF
jgi:methylated-DNA-[protein]-cysteine S-methyltransferase